MSPSPQEADMISAWGGLWLPPGLEIDGLLAAGLRINISGGTIALTDV